MFFVKEFLFDFIEVKKIVFWRFEILIYLIIGFLLVVDFFILCKIFIERISFCLFLFKFLKLRMFDKCSGFFLVLLNK